MKIQQVNKNLFQDKEYAIKIEHLFCVYNEDTENEIVSLCDNNLDLQKNKIHFIVGNSGCGKSTLINHFNGLLRSRYGNVLVQNNYKIGEDLFLNNLLLGVLNEPQTKLEESFFLPKKNLGDGYFVAFNQKLPKSLIKIVFEAYYKVSIDKVVTLKTKNDLRAYYYFLKPNSTDYVVNVLDHKKVVDIEQSYEQQSKNSEWQLWYKKFKNQKKIKKIKTLKKTVGIVFQFPEYQLFKDSVLKDVMFGPLTLGINKDVARKKSIEYLEQLGIGEKFLERSPFDLSGGQKRRVAIAGILAFDPEIIVFDEPTAGLDPFGEQEILAIIQQAKDAGKTVVVISHNMDHVLEKADNVVVMNDGEIIQTGKPYEIFTNPQTMSLTALDKPQIIHTIEELIKQNPKFKMLWDFEPRNIEELAKGIAKIVKKENII